jgi:hypothetical protein
MSRKKYFSSTSPKKLKLTFWLEKFKLNQPPHFVRTQFFYFVELVDIMELQLTASLAKGMVFTKI